MEPVYSVLFFLKTGCSYRSYSIHMLFLLFQAPGAVLLDRAGVEEESVKEGTGKNINELFFSFSLLALSTTVNIGDYLFRLFPLKPETCNL